MDCHVLKKEGKSEKQKRVGQLVVPPLSLYSRPPVQQKGKTQCIGQEQRKCRGKKKFQALVKKKKEDEEAVAGVKVDNLARDITRYQPDYILSSRPL